MSPHLVKIVLFLPFLFIEWAALDTTPRNATELQVSGSTGKPQLPSSGSFSVIQRPLFLNLSEGSDATLNCRVEGNVSSRWYVNWKKMEKKEKILKNSSRILVINNTMNKSSILILNSTVAADSGIYHCEICDSGYLKSGSTNVTIWENPYLAVNQNPQHVGRRAGENVSITCSFSRVPNASLINVTWYKDNQELMNPKYYNNKRQKVTLRLMNVNVEDSGNYVCMIRIGNRTGSGNGTHVNITRHKEPPQITNIETVSREPDLNNNGSQIGIPVGVGVAAGTLIFLLLLGFLVWRSKRKSKGASENPLEVEPTVAKEDKKHTLTKQISDVTYADIRFHKREAQPDTEVVYAEVRLDTKWPECGDRGTQPAGFHLEC
ncbi:tyrosine-protein phosphatase non-receptor type substrate 1-like [Erythrolamprus reginae]|uniref:tyrosine-protein phosphatase non-receptor type substrate 1-like n=1 Tax=Erythrolamprus reginae TaxID=121349 RepID=UPI00396C4C9B